MRQLIESLLDDEDILVKDTHKAVRKSLTDKNKQRKEDIIKFIDDHYYFVNMHNNRLKARYVIKINKDWSVDVPNKKENIYKMTTETFSFRNNINNKEVFPTGDLFTWGDLNVMYDMPMNASNKEIGSTPIRIKEILCRNCKHIKSLEGFPKNIDRIGLDDVDILSLKGCPKELESISIFGCDTLGNLKGLPDTIKNVSLCYNKNLKSFEGAPSHILNFCQIASHSEIIPLKDLKDNCLKGANLYIRSDSNDDYKTEDILRLNPATVNHKDIKEYLKILKNNNTL